MQDYDPFGMIQVGRSWKRKDYRFSFNGKEDESWGVQDFDARMFDNRLGRFLSVDPLSDRMPFISPYSFCYNNPIILVDDDGKIPIVPLLVKASVNALTDIFVQATFAYVFDDDVNSFGDAFQKVNGWQVLISAGEGAFTPGGKSGKFIKAGLMGAGDVVFNASKAYLSDQDYTLEDAGKDFVGGFISDLSGGQVSELIIIKYGMKNVVKGFAKIGLDAKTINNLTGLKLTTQATKGIKSLQEQISLHKKKLADYRKNPDAFDNQGHLKRVGNNKVLREKIINARIDGLKKEIKKFEGEIDKLISGKTVPLPKQKSNGTN